jgi:predicted lipid-binding transport protein (Tim44 family)
LPGKSEWAKYLTLALVASLLLLTATDALARAGGGGSYGGSSRSSGGGEGLGVLFYFLIQLAIHKPVIGVPLLILAVFLLWKFGKTAKGAQETRTITRGSRAARRQSAAAMEEKLAALKARDEGFSREGFLQKVNRAFIAVQEAWSDQDMEKVRHFVSDGVVERFSIQIAMQRSEGYRNLMEDVTVLDSKVVAVDSDSSFDTVHVEVRAQAKDTDVDLETGKRIRTNTTHPFTEYWSFLRRPGAKTLEKGGLVEGFCPNCGAPIEINEAGQCEACDSQVTSGQYDWVLAEITQAVEWSALQKPELVPGYTEMKQADPAFSLQHIEDRTSVIFWRLIKSWFDNDPAPARKMLIPQFFEGFGKTIRGSRSGDSWAYFREPAVGAVEVQTIRQGEQGGMDRVEVLVKWSARNARRDGSGRSRGAGDKAIRPQVYVLVRRHGVSTPSGMTFMSSHCPGCGAPYGSGSGGECEYCGRTLNDGSQDWVLASIEHFSASRITSQAVAGLERAALVPPDLMLSAMASAMYADGEIDDREMELIRSFAESREIPREKVQAIMSSLQQGTGQLPKPSGPAQARKVLEAMARMTLADGRLTGGEKKLLYAFGSSCGLSRADVNLTVAAEKKKLYREAKRRLKT